MPQKPIQRNREIELKDVIRDEKGNVKRTKGKTKKIQVPLPKDPIIEQHRKNLQVINDFITQHCISLDLTDEQSSRVMYKPSEEDDTKDDEASKQVNLHSVQLSRIFARGSLNKGGRFYRGFWQHLPSIHRPHIRINGYKTVEVDFGGIGIRILYSLKGLPLEMEDPYDIGLPDWKGSNDKRRPAVKKAFNALINDEDGVYNLDKGKQELLGVSHEGFKELVKKVHPEIADLFQSEKGLQAQYIDSRIAEKVMLSLAKEGILALPIHDSFIVRSGYDLSLKAAMKEAFYEITGQRINLSASIVKDSNCQRQSKTDPLYC